MVVEMGGSPRAAGGEAGVARTLWVMTGEARKRQVLLAVGLSLLVHGGGAYVAARTPMAGGGGGRARGVVDEGWTLELRPEPAPEVAGKPVKEPERAETAMPSVVKPPAVEPEPVLVKAEPPPMPEPEAMRLGIDESPHKVEDWIGWKETTAHKARLSEVNQPELDPKPGAPGETSPTAAASSPEQPPAPVAPELAPSPMAGRPGESHAAPRPDAPAPAEAAPAPVLPTPMDAEPRPSDEKARPDVERRPERAKADETLPESDKARDGQRPDAGADEAPKAREARPGVEGAPISPTIEFTPNLTLRPTPALERGPEQPKEQTSRGSAGGLPSGERLVEGPGAEAAKAGGPAGAEVGPAREEMKATGPAAAPKVEALEGSPEAKGAEATRKTAPAPSAAPAVTEAGAPAVGRPETQTPAAPLPAPPSLPMPTKQQGNGGERPAIESDKQSDATSTQETVEIDPGRNAAAQGLDIVTRRPYFTRLTRVTARPSNPLVRITFNRQGRVSRVEMVESSGNEDVDGPVINACYQWTARGRALSELPEGKVGKTLTVRILLH